MTHYILSIDGGGYRGLYSAYILKRIKEEFNVDFTQRFELIAGTSTGSIIASALSLGMSPEEITKLYENKGSEIFPKNKFKIGLFQSKYSSNVLYGVLDSVFGDKTMKDVKTNLIIPATDIANGGVHVIKSPYNSEFVRDKDRLIKDVVLSSSSAPTFFDPHYSNEYLLADGGLWANNPSLVATIDGIRRLNWKLDDIKVLSIGTGMGKNYHPIRLRNKKWGIVNGWGISNFISSLLNLQSISHTNFSMLLLGSNFMRINFESEDDLPLDDISHSYDLKSRANYDFTHNSAKIKQFLDI
jgi:uncharacterized protein